MAEVYIENSDLELRREDIEESSDIEELTEWLKEQDRVASELAIMIGAVKNDPSYEVRGLVRRLGFTKVSIMWLRKRLEALGEDHCSILAPHVPSAGKALKAHLKVVEQAGREKSAKIKALNLELTALRQELARYRKASKQAEATDA